MATIAFIGPWHRVAVFANQYPERVETTKEVAKVSKCQG